MHLVYYHYLLFHTITQIYLYFWVYDVSPGNVLFTVPVKWSFPTHSVTLNVVLLCVRDAGVAGADEHGHAAGGAERLLRTPPPQTHEVQERQLPQLPGLQTREAWLGLLRTPGVRHPLSVRLHSHTHTQPLITIRSVCCTHTRPDTPACESSSGCRSNSSLTQLAFLLDSFKEQHL